MPHNLYLHSALVQSRAFPRTPAGRREAATYGTVDSCVALVFAGFVNAAILITAGAVWNGNADAVSALPQAARLLAPALGSQAATLLFGCGLLASGQQSTVTGTLAGQVVMEGCVRLSAHPGGATARAAVAPTVALPDAAAAGCWAAACGSSRGRGAWLRAWWPCCLPWWWPADWEWEALRRC